MMSPRTRRVGVLTIGQSPRPDLLEPLRVRLPADVAIIEAGALDGHSPDDLPARAGAYPLTTRWRDGSPATVDEAFLSPLVQTALEALQRGGADVVLLLCAGGFADLRPRGRLVRPFEAAVDALRDLGARRVGVVVPIDGQSWPSQRKWRLAGFEPTVVVGEPATIDIPASIEALVLDFVGHPSEVVEAFRARSPVPVVDLGEAGAAAAAAHFG
ncbi:MAG: AroM family protein [Candidatus Limnocylindrales bacterium]